MPRHIGRLRLDAVHEPSGRIHFCAVGRPDFSAPELLGHDLATHVRSRESDLYALAIHIYMLLMAGNHLFLRGNWLGTGEPPGAMELAKTSDWAGGRNSRLRTHPLAPAVTFLPDPIQQLFERAFTRGTTDPKARPDPGEWHDALTGVKVVDCSRGSHQVPLGAHSCPWCAIADERARRRKPLPLQSQSIDPIKAPPVAKSSPATTARPSPPSRQPAPGNPYAKKSRPPFKATTAQNRAKKVQPAPQNFSEAIGQSLYRLFLYIGIPSAIPIAIMVIWVVVYTIQQL